ncbi:MAG: tryptophan-rich sensory protein [Candidatus Niyogibacteria bacterium]|nr:tryptophan-rich sensory protein [Candidatus Niyogibacteria bacterium]
MIEKSDFVKFSAAIMVSELSGALGSAFAGPVTSDWYAGLVKPAFTPSDWIFGPVWITFYALMGAAAFLVWKRGFSRHKEDATIWHKTKVALAAFGIQLVFNALWSILFFGLQSPFWALADVAILWLSIVWMIWAFDRVYRFAAALMLPYLFWVSFAAYLNYAIWMLN